MKSILALIAALVSAPVFAMDLGQVEATINSCRNGLVCSCPRARINLVGLIKTCGNGPDIKLDQDSNFSNRKEFEAWGKCGKEVDAANDEIRRYNAIFDHCQRPNSKSEDVRRPLTNQPHISTGTPDSDKTLAEQETEAKAAERAQEQALREQEAAGQAEEDRAYAAAHRPVIQPQPPSQQQQPQQMVTDDGLPLIRCAPGFNPFLDTSHGGRSADSYPKVICLTSTPVLYGHRLSSIQGSEIWVVSELAWFNSATSNPPR